MTLDFPDVDRVAISCRGIREPDDLVLELLDLALNKTCLSRCKNE
jgi:hypothetical protein